LPHPVSPTGPRSAGELVTAYLDVVFRQGRADREPRCVDAVVPIGTVTRPLRQPPWVSSEPARAAGVPTGSGQGEATDNGDRLGRDEVFEATAELLQSTADMLIGADGLDEPLAVACRRLAHALDQRRSVPSEQHRHNAAARPEG